MPVADLLRELDARVAQGFVRQAADGPLSLFIYTDRCVFDEAWDDISRLARGLIVDRAAGRLVATPFPKFFNYGEKRATLSVDIPLEPFVAYEKVDGSLGIVFHHAGRWRVATKGAFASEQALWAQAWIDARPKLLSQFTPGATYLFEIVYSANRIVVRYGDEELVLIGAYDADGRELEQDELIALAQRAEVRMCRTFAFNTIDEIVDAAAKLDASAEGWVLRFASGARLKLKGAEYLRLHRIISRVTPLGLWEAIGAGDSLDEIRRQIPEEFWADFDRIRELLEAKLAAIEAKVAEEVAKWTGKADKEIGLALATLDADVRRYVFAARKLGAKWVNDDRLRQTMLRQIRPGGNALEGYKPTNVLRRFESESG